LADEWIIQGGVTQAAQIADFYTSLVDTNAQVNLSNQTIATWLEHLALKSVLELLNMDESQFPGRTLTTGATSANLLGLAVARQQLCSWVHSTEIYSAADNGCDITIKVFSAGAHASIAKVASILGIGRLNVLELLDPSEDSGPCSFDLIRLESELKRCNDLGQGAIVVPSVGEVNTVSHPSAHSISSA